MKKILVVDDDEELLEVLSLEFSRRGYEVLTSTTGRDALTLVQTKKPDILLIDVMIPGMDGYHLAHEISTRLGEQAPKMLIITGRQIEGEKSVALLSGAATIIQKPLDLRKLGDMVSELLKPPI